MNLGIAWRTAIACASIRGLGRACAAALAAAGCRVVVNGRNKAVLETDAHRDRRRLRLPCWAQAGYVTGQSLLIDGGALPGIM